jgi:sigma-B regulation protein RsbU (phosphoserine phosphatase)
MTMKSPRARVLVVDDDPGVLRAVKRILESSCEVAGFSSPAEAQAMVPTFAPDLAILDIRMPVMDGFELMQRMKFEQPELDVIFITGSMTEPEANLIRAIRQGAFYYIQKPFDRDVLQTLVERCLELRRLRTLADRELHNLRRAQSRLLPQSAPIHPEFLLAFRYRPFYFATGDYYGFFPRADGDLAVFVGDSSGHGPSACMLMATMRTLLFTHPEVHSDPGSALSSLNRMFHALAPDDLFMTAMYLVLEQDGRIRWAAAAQHPPVRVRHDGELSRMDLAPVGLPLGIEPTVHYETVSWDIDAGERLVVFTDGIIEATNNQGKQFGLARVQKSVARLARTSASPDSLLDALVDEVGKHMEGSDFEDDFTVLAIERR